MNFLRLAELDLAGKRVFIRADFNVPFNADGTLSDDTRIRATLPAICHCLEAGAAVMITSHLGRPTEGALTAADSLAPVAATLSALLGRLFARHASINSFVRTKTRLQQKQEEVSWPMCPGNRDLI